MNKLILILGLTTLSFSSPTSSGTESITLSQIIQERSYAANICLDSKSKDNSTKKKRKYTRQVSRIKELALNPIFIVDRGVVMDIKHTLEKAIMECDFEGKCIITSALRKHNRHSQHSKGEAIDISWRRKGKEFGEWLISEQGIKWLDKHNLDFYFENIKQYKGHPKYFYNRNATAPHIHLFIK